MEGRKKPPAAAGLLNCTLKEHTPPAVTKKWSVSWGLSLAVPQLLAALFLGIQGRLVQVLQSALACHQPKSCV
jgi:hypothetical protein